jgi:hypothetical protein
VNAPEIIVRVVSNCLILAIILTFIPAFEPQRKRVIFRFLYILGRYAIPPGVILAIFYWFAFRRAPHE